MAGRRFAWAVAGILGCLCAGLLGVWVETAPAGARQDTATPAVGPCEAILSGGTPVVEHAPSGQSAFDPNSTEQAGETGNAADYAFDLVFIDAMILHQAGAAAMAEIALAEGERPEIRDLAATIVAARETEIGQLRTWRDAWYPGSDPVPANVVTGIVDEGAMTAGAIGGMGQGSMASDTRLALGRLCVRAGPFDLAFLQEMIPHAQSAVGMANLALGRGEHPGLMNLAAAIVATQEAEIAQMSAWQAEWYPPNGPADAGGDGSPDGGTPAT